jgi:peptide/nickel transport system ATP-binding protein
MSEPLAAPDGAAAAVGPDASAPALAVRDLRVTYLLADGGELPALRGVSFAVRRGEALGIVGESGSGKSSLLLALMGLLPNARVGGSAQLGDAPLPLGDEPALQPMRWRRIALAFQGASEGFDPVYPVGVQLVEPLRDRLRLGPSAAAARAREWWERVGLPADRFGRFPHELSGGEKRRAMLAMALTCGPEVVLVDELTAGLDAVAKTNVLDLLQTLRAELGLTLVLVSHDLADVRHAADRTLVLYAGQVVEEAATRPLLADPRHPYSWGLVGAYPALSRARDLWGIRGEPPDPMRLPDGCAFHPRCTQAVEQCRLTAPPLAPTDDRLVACHLGGLQTLLEARGLSKTFAPGGARPVTAVRDASLAVREGELVALVGASGSGKSTLARLLVGLLPPDAGTILLEGQDLLRLRGPALAAAQRRIQLIFQDPRDALSPRLPVLGLVREPLEVQGMLSKPERDASARQALAEVRLPTTPAFLGKYAYELSGGQLQRVAIARALVLAPKLLVADEPVAMLDVSEQAHVLRLLKDLQNARGMGLLLISHDLGLVRKVADRIAVMQAGQIVEVGPADHVIGTPAHIQTRLLLGIDE